MTKLGNYLRKHERPYEIRVPNGKGEIRVMFYDGYITIRSHQRGVHYGNEIHITRKAWRKLLSPQLVKVTRLMEGPSFDRYRAERRYYREEAKHLADQRELKRQLRPRSRRRAKTRVRRGQA